MAKNGQENGRMANGRYTKGHNGGSGGVKGRSGRHPSSVTIAAQTVVDKHQLIEVLGAIATADIGEQLPTRDGEPIYSETKNSDRIAAIKLLLAYGYGQPTQVVTHQGDADNPLEVTVQHRQELVGRLDRIAARFATAADSSRSGAERN